MPHEPSTRVDILAREVVDAAVAVHRELGPGFGESLYERALCVELTMRGVHHERQVLVELRYREQLVGSHRLDLVVGGLLIVELKAVEMLTNVHVSQVVAYLKSTKKELGLLINFNVALLRQGLRRVALSRSAS